MIGFALIVALSTLAAGVVLALAVRLLPTVRLQLVGLALLAVVLPLAAVILGGLVMFHMHDDVRILAVAAASASTALVAALLVGGRIARRIRGLEIAAGELSSGELAARAPTQGPRELAHVGESFNAMAANIEALFDARRQLVAWASHDLRTPVASIQAMLEAVEDGLASIDEYMPALRQQTLTLATLIATWCAASGTSPRTPSIKAVARNRVASTTMVAPIGRPMARSSAITFMSGGTGRT